MATLTTIPAPLQTRKPHREWNTLEVLLRSRMALFGLTTVLLVAMVFAVQTHRSAMQLVGKDTAPSIIKAQEIKSSLAAMDADAVNELLDRNDKQAQKLFEQHRISAAKAVVEAAHNITFGEAESKPIENVEVVMGEYEREVQEALDQRDAGHPDQELAFYRSAAGVMDRDLLPQAEALDKANTDVLEDEYKARSGSSLTSRIVVLSLGVALCIGLVLAQLYLLRRMRRIVNPALLAATVITFGLTLFTFAMLQREQSELTAAKESAFGSAHALLQARAVAYAANSDESRFLLDPERAQENLKSFDSKIALLATMPSVALETEMRTGQPIVGFRGYLADEYNNITLPHEQEAAIESVTALKSYLALDQDLRGLERDGKHQQAIALCVGSQPGESDYAFDQFDAALDHTLKINMDEFDRAVQSGFNAVSNLELESCLAGLLIIALIFFGYAPRIREYQ